MNTINKKPIRRRKVSVDIETVATKSVAVPVKKKIISSPDSWSEEERQNLLVNLADARAQISGLTTAMKANQAELLAALQQAGLEGMEVQRGQHKYSATIVSPTKLVIDEDKIRKGVGVSIWNKISRRVLDRNLLDAEMKNNPAVLAEVAKASSETPISEYVKITTS